MHAKVLKSVRCTGMVYKSSDELFEMIPEPQPTKEQPVPVQQQPTLTITRVVCGSQQHFDHSLCRDLGHRFSELQRHSTETPLKQYGIASISAQPF